MISDSSETGESEDETLDGIESLSDEESSEDTDQIVSDDPNESAMITRSKRRVINRVNYSDEKYFKSRLGTDPDAARMEKKTSFEDETKKKRLKTLSSKPNHNSKNDRSGSQKKKNSVTSSTNNSKSSEESGDDEDLEDDNVSNYRHEEESLEENSDQGSED